MNGILIETDLIVEFLTAGSDARPLLRTLLQTATCYTTFIHAAEIYSSIDGDEERRTVDRALFGLKILGASSRYAKTIGDALSSMPTTGSYRTAIVAGIALESHLPVVTDLQYDALSQVPGLHLVAAEKLRQLTTREALLDALASGR
jgi:predicted nucleic acid-binding protein